MDDSINHIVFKKSNFRKLENAISFISRMNSIGITVTLHPYSSLYFKPPFHGRYWLTGEKGYIVDGSLQTYSSGMIFAQLMDDENFYLIKNQLFDRRILNNAVSYESITLYDLCNFRTFFRMNL